MICGSYDGKFANFHIRGKLSTKKNYLVSLPSDKQKSFVLQGIRKQIFYATTFLGTEKNDGLQYKTVKVKLVNNENGLLKLEEAAQIQDLGFDTIDFNLKKYLNDYTEEKVDFHYEASGVGFSCSDREIDKYTFQVPADPWTGIQSLKKSSSCLRPEYSGSIFDLKRIWFFWRPSNDCVLSDPLSKLSIVRSNLSKDSTTAGLNQTGPTEPKNITIVLTWDKIVSEFDSKQIEFFESLLKQANNETSYFKIKDSLKKLKQTNDTSLQRFYLNTLKVLKISPTKTYKVEKLKERNYLITADNIKLFIVEAIDNKTFEVSSDFKFLVAKLANESSVFIYNGHSGMGSVFDSSFFDSLNANLNFKLLVLISCYSYNYFSVANTHFKSIYLGNEVIDPEGDILSIILQSLNMNDFKNMESNIHKKVARLDAKPYLIIQ